MRGDGGQRENKLLLLYIASTAVRAQEYKQGAKKDWSRAVPAGVPGTTMYHLPHDLWYIRYYVQFVVLIRTTILYLV